MIRNGIFLFIFAFFVLAVFMPSYRDLQDLRSRNTALEEEIRQLKERHLELAEEKRRLEDDPVYLESVAREKMGIVREGEVILKVNPADIRQ